ncbi:10199_t:CDS:2 [Ambispora leptoticha]|uniref:10199_t:CDS:1 n=1 Tax=Ambispora leptoticha TaxID=144679 RepID=A0A9N9B543_9GLOM|nr:10199_t:CDS:2 [Ambispora leptoticha]
MVVLIRNTCLFQGEEKPHEDIGDPSKELVDKFNDWTYRDASYIFAYYAVDYLLLLVANLYPPRKLPEF